MTVFRRLVSIVSWILRRDRAEQQLDDEIRAFVEMSTADRIREGTPPVEARRLALAEIGGVERMKESVRAGRHGALLDDFGRDVRYAFRSLSRNRGFAAVVALTLGVGVAANTAVFSVVNAVVLKPLKTPGGDRLVRSLSVAGGQSNDLTDPNTFKVWMGLGTIFEDVSAHRLDLVNVIGGSEPEQVPAGRVSEAFFRLFRAPLVAGRTFIVEEDRPNGPAVAVLSSNLWMRRFGGDPAIVGQTITLGSVPHVIVGIIGTDFDSEQFEPSPELWLPLQANPDRVDGGSIYQVTARLRSGVTHDRANAALAVEYARANTARDANRPGTWIAMPLQQAMARPVRTSLNLLQVSVGLLLVIACANVANLLLVRADMRQREMAIRAAIGAGRGRIARQLVIEHMLLALVGGSVGLVTGIFAAHALLRSAPGYNPFMLGALSVIPRVGEAGNALTVDWRVLGFVLLISVMTGVVFGLVPTRHIGRLDLSTVLQRTNVAMGAGRQRFSVRAISVIAQVALSVILVMGSALLIRTSLALREVDPGFDAEHVLTMRMAVSDTHYETRDGISQLTAQGIQRIQQIPGVSRASTACCMPLEIVWQLPFVIASRASEGLTRTSTMSFHGFGGWTFISPGYFAVLGVPILKGRDFSFDDDAKAPGVVIINEAMARRFWPNSDPLKDQLIIGRGMRAAYDGEPVRRIVGIVGNIRDTRLTDNPRPGMYVPVAQEPDGVTTVNVKLLPLVWVVRTTGDPLALSRPIKTALESGFGQLPVTRIRALKDVVGDSTARITFNTWLMTTFGICALGLAAVGVYGLVSYWVQQLSREIGIRLALGAGGRGVARMVIGHAMKIVAIGIAIGMVAALGLAQLMSGLVFGVTPRDPVVFVGVALLLAITALVAVSLPALRASRIDPLQALRSE